MSLQPRRQRRRGCRQISLLCLYTLLIAIGLLAHSVHGQRAAVNLSQKIQNRFAKSAGRGNIVEGENKPTRTDKIGKTSRWFHIAGLREPEIPVNPPNLIATIVLAAMILAALGIYLPQSMKRDLRVGVRDDELKIEGGNVVGTEPIDLAFEGLTLKLETKSGEVRTLLDGVRGRAQPGRMLAVMGPSGAGKSTLIHALVGRVKDNSKLSLYGRRYINGEPVSGDSLLPAAFIEQDVNFFPHMTVRETLHFRVELKLGSLLSKHARDKMVDGLMDQLGLTKAADTVVGDAKVRGISGGERKRLSIAVEMISSPSVIVLDEPTSGLDSTAATSLVQTLRDLADSGKTVIAVIHQPSQHVFAKFDDLLLVSEGKLMYYGELHGVRSYMESYGHPATAEMGTAEHILDCISRLPIEEETKDEMNSRMERLIYKANSNPLDLGKMPTDDNGTTEFAMVSRGGPKAGIITQFRTLFKRSFREVIRGKTTLILKTVQQISLGVIYGGIYSLGTNQASIQDRFGLLSLIAIGSANMAVASTIRSFPREKAIVSNEIASKMYRTLPYFIGKALSELPLVAVFNGIFGTIVYHLTGLSRMKGKFRRFLGLLTTHGLASEAVGLVIGAVSPSSDVALAIFPAVLVLNIIFDGKNISEENTPRLLRWIPKIGLIRWGFEGLCVNEFDQLTFDTKGPRRGPVAKFGSEALDRFGLGTNTLGDIVKAQLSITVVSWALSYIGLTLTGQKYLKMQSFKSDSD